MDVVVLSVVCGTGLVLAVVAVIRWGGERQPPAPLVVPGAPPPVGATAVRLLRSLSISLLAGGLAGMLTAGLGGRLMMRILAGTSSDRAQGLTSDAEETIGEITLGGTIGLVMFVGLISGVLGGITYYGVRRWVPGSARRAGLVLGLLAIGLAPMIGALDRESVDFEFLDPDPLAILLIGALFPLWGMTVAAFVERAEQGWPAPGWSLGGVAAYVPLLLLVPGAVLLAFVLAIGLVVLLLQHVEVLARAVRSRAFNLCGRAVLVAVVVLAVFWAGSHAVDILTGEDLFALR